ncbi:MAG: hypothetical protein LBT00_11495 [Spirochaetaceae bacterium]|jgi:hypothetical protein|nr:hypothetical protein [Spirochaetaceae bacterium]
MNNSFNLEKIPFSAPGSYIAVGKDPAEKGGGIWIRTLIRPEWGTGRPKVSDHVLRLVPCRADMRFCEYEIDFKPHLLTLKTQEGKVEIAFSEWESLAISADNASLVLEYGHADNVPVNTVREREKFIAYFPVSFYTVTLTVQGGDLAYRADCCRIFVSSRENQRWKLIFNAAQTRLPAIEAEFPYKNPAAFLADFNAFCGKYETDGKNNADGNVVSHRTLALYLLFTSSYTKRGYFLRDCCAASKNLMNLVWGWDNCFISLALAQSRPDLCWDNILVFFELQKEDGSIPDAINPYLVVDWFVKPPVQGFFIELLLDAGCLPPEKDRAFLINGMIRWTEFWQNRRCNDVGLFYYAHGFDSGWDNATCFDGGTPCITPDVNAYMAFQFSAIARLLRLSGKTAEAAAWERKTTAHIERMIRDLFSNGAFMCISPENRPFQTTSLIRLIPVILGKRLPEHVRRALITELKTEGHFLTPRGFATECLDSALYDQRRGDPNKPNAYWRGPLWPPAMFLLVRGLADCGEKEFARDSATRFVKTLEGRPDTFYENYDALFNEGYDDTAYLWTSAVYILLKNFIAGAAPA